jgi:hypothetical protein
MTGAISVNSARAASDVGELEDASEFECLNLVGQN